MRVLAAMPPAQPLFVGIDPTAAHKAFVYAALDRNLSLVTMAEGELGDVLAFLDTQTHVIVAINAPSSVSRGLVRLPSARMGSMRQAEYELRRRGIPVGGTGKTEALCPPWVQLGFTLYRRLGEQGFRPYPAEGAARRWLETHPHACFCALLNRRPFHRASLEGRLQRALILYERGLQIRDPMDFFEEITRHRLLSGHLPLDLLPLPEQLDALVAAYTAWLAVQQPEKISRLGDAEEGQIVLPGEV